MHGKGGRAGRQTVRRAGGYSLLPPQTHAHLLVFPALRVTLSFVTVCGVCARLSFYRIMPQSSVPSLFTSTRSSHWPCKRQNATHVPGVYSGRLHARQEGRCSIVVDLIIIHGIALNGEVASKPTETRGRFQALVTAPPAQSHPLQGGHVRDRETMSSTHS